MAYHQVFVLPVQMTWGAGAPSVRVLATLRLRLRWTDALNLQSTVIA